MPEVVDDSGYPIVGPELDAVLKRVTDMAQVAQLAKIRKILEKKEFQGKLDPRPHLAVTDNVVYVDLVNNFPLTPWTKADFTNKGPSIIYVNINEPYYPVPIDPGDEFNYDSQMADVRIRLFSYWCDKGLTSILDIVAKY